MTPAEEPLVPSNTVRNLGVLIDNNLQMESQVKRTSSICLSLLRMLRQVLPLLPSDSRSTVVSSLVSSRLDYCNALYLGAPQYLIQRLQRIQSMAAKLALNRKQNPSSTLALRDLHWLRIKERIHFKSLCLVFKAVHDQGPIPLQKKLKWYMPARQLRSSNTGLLRSIRSRRVRTGDRAFSVAASSLWNELPQQLRQSSSLMQFRRGLKTWLFPKP